MKMFLYFLACLVISNTYGQADKVLKFKEDEARLETEIRAKSDSLAIIRGKIAALQTTLHNRSESGDLNILATVRRKGEIRVNPNASSTAFLFVNEGEALTVRGYQSGYWLVEKDDYTGYLNELFVNESPELINYKEALTKGSQQNSYSPATSPSEQNTYQGKKSKNTSRSRVIYTGPRGGRYYINSNGNKTYIKRK